MTYLNQNPTVADILMAVHKITVKGVKSMKGRKTQNEDEFMNSFYHVPEFGVETGNAPKDFKDSIQFALDMENKLKIN